MGNINEKVNEILKQSFRPIDLSKAVLPETLF